MMAQVGANERPLAVKPSEYGYVALDILHVIRSEGQAGWQSGRAAYDEWGGLPPGYPVDLRGFLGPESQHIYT